MTKDEAPTSPKDAALKLALEALEVVLIHGYVTAVGTPNGVVYLQPAITAIKEALAQPEEQQSCDKQEPVLCQYAIDVAMPEYRCAGKCQYAHPPPRPWVGLTDEDKDEIIRVTESDHYHDILMLAEAKLKEKNT